jgi:CHAT domain-containing protein/Tfp pilus assembly protein PilF
MQRTQRHWTLDIGHWSLVIALCLLASLHPLHPSPSADDAVALKAVVDKFFDAFAKKDLDGFMSLWSQKSPDYASRKQGMQRFFAANDYTFAILAISRVQVEGDAASLRATLRVAVDMTSRPSAQPSNRPTTQRLIGNFALVKEEGAWKVWRFSSAFDDLAAALSAAKTEEGARLLLEEKELATAELVRALITRGSRFFNQGNYPQALTLYRLAQSIAEQIGDKAGIAATLDNVGIVHQSQGNYAQALEFHQKSLKMEEELDNKAGIAATLINIGIVHESQGNYTQALEFYQKGLSLAEQIGHKPWIVNALNNIGIVHKSQGNYAQALQFYQKSLRMREELGDKAGMAAALTNIGTVHTLQSNYAQALEFYQKSLRMREELGDKAGIAAVLVNIGIVHTLQDNYTQALEFYQKGLSLAEQIGHKPWIVNALLNIGLVHSRQRNYAQALEFYQKSLRMREELGDKAGIARTLGNIGSVHYLQGNSAQALDFADRAAALARQIGYPEALWQARVTAGKSYRALHQSIPARQALDEAIAIIETMRSQVAGGEREQQRFFEDKVSPYHAMVELLISENKISDALAYAERAKARVLLDVLQSGKVNITKAMTETERERERALNNELVSLNTQITREKLRPQPDPSRLKELDDRLNKARLDYEAFRTSLYAAHPELRVKRGEAQVVTLEEAGALLPDTKSALLEFVVTEEKTFLFVLTHNVQGLRVQGSELKQPSTFNPQPLTLKAYALDIKREALEKLIKDFRRLLEVKEESQRFDQSARALYNHLLKPTQAQLQGKTTLCIVPDGDLWDLPFQALQSQQNRYLIEDYTLFYVPSLTALREMQVARSNVQTLPTLLAFGNPARVEPPLPEAETLVKGLGVVYGAARSKVYVGAEAHEGRLKAEAQNADVLQLATHAELSNVSPMYSRLVLSQEGRDGDEDGLLEAWEVMNLGLKANLAVLSACETARGKARPGEGMIGMTWAFFVAGCPTIVASQWKVRAGSTRELMLEFHRQLKSQISNPKSQTTKAESLRQAALKMLRRQDEFSHPYHWAGFVLVGDGR